MKFYTHYHKIGDSVCVVGFNEEGRRVQLRYPALNDLHVPYEEDEDGSSKAGGLWKGWTTIHGERLATFRLNPEAQKQFIRTAEKAAIPWYGRQDVAAHVINGVFPQEMTPVWRWVQKGIAYLDIETDMETGNKAILSLSCKKGGRNTCWGLKEYRPYEGGVDHFLQFNEEADMLNAFVQWWERDYPVVVAHINGDAFDIKIIVDRVTELLGRKVASRLAPWGWIKKTTVTSNTGRKVPGYELVGIPSVDWALAYGKFVDLYASERLDSLSLENIAQRVLGEGKKPYEGSLTTLYQNDYASFIEYMAHDSNLIERMEAKHHLIETMFYMAMNSKSNVTDSMGTVKMWDNRIANNLAKRKIAVPNEVEQVSDISVLEKARGGWVMPTNPGRHEWICLIDFNSLYPRIIETFNISPDTKVDVGPHREGHIYSALGVNFLPKSQKVGFLPSIISYDMQLRDNITLEMATETDELKLENLGVQRNRIKIEDNSLYGSLLNMFSRWYDIELGESITLTGQLATKTMVEELEAGGLPVVAGDTDSCFIAVGEYMRQHDIEPSLEAATAVCETVVNPIIKRAIKRVTDAAGVTSPVTLNMVIDIVADKAIWAGKKNYILSMVSEKGKKQEKIIVKGLRVKKRNTPMLHRRAIMKMVRDHILDKESQIAFMYAVDEHVKYCKTVDPVLLAETMTLGKPLWLYVRKNRELGEPAWKKGTPMQYKAALEHNRLASEMAAGRPPPLVEKDTVRLFPLKKGWGFDTNVIANANDLMSPDMLREAFDYEAVLQKNFWKPLRQITDALGWEI